MPRNPNSTLERIAHYLSACSKPVSFAEIEAAGIASRPTLYRLLIDRDARERNLVDVPVTAKIFGIYAVGGTYPAHYTYRDPMSVEFTDALLEHKHNGLNRVAEQLNKVEAIVPDKLERAVLDAFKQHRAVYKKDDVLADNFTKDSQSVESYFTILDGVRDMLLSDSEEGLTKFRTLMLSFFVSGILNESE